MAKKKIDQQQQVAEVIRPKAIGQVAEDCYTLYGSYVNTHRAIANVSDGCKVSYKRIIYMMTKHPRGKDIPTHEFVPSLSEIHPHSTDGCEGLNAALVRSGVFTGHGFFGNTDIDGTVNPHAATRYTKNRLSDLYWDVIGDLIKEVPYEESPQGPLEPEYIPLVLPLCMYMRGGLVSGLGVGVSTIYPNFSPWSMYLAYKNNNPQLLEPNVDLILDKSNSELERLWKTGKGKVTYVYKISRTKSPDGKTDGILFETANGTEIFTPKLKKFSKLIEDGKVYVEDLTDQNGAKLFIGRVPGARGITVDEIEALARKCCYDSTTYQLNVTDGKSAFRIPLYNWLDYTYNNYIKLLGEVNKKRIEKCKFDIAVQEAIPIVANYIITVNPAATDEELCKKLGLPVEVVSEVMSKPISYLRKNKDTSERVKVLKEKLKELKKFNPVVYTEEVIKKL